MQYVSTALDNITGTISSGVLEVANAGVAHSQEIMTSATDALNGMVNQSKNAMSTINNTTKNVTSKVENLGTALQNQGSSIINNIKGAASSAGSIGGDLVTGVYQGAVGAVKGDIENFNAGAVLEGAAQPALNEFNDLKNGILEDLNTAKKPIVDFFKNFNPDGGDLMSSVQTIADVLRCPSQFLLPDLKRAVSSIKNRIKNLNPKELLKRTKQALINAIKNQFPGINNLVEFAVSAAQYLKQFLNVYGFGKKKLKGMIEDTLREYGYSIQDANKISSFKILMNIYNADDISLNLGEKFNMAISPRENYKPVDSIKCSELAKIMDSLTSTFNTTERYDLLRYNESMFKKLSRDDLKNFLRQYYNVSNNTRQRESLELSASSFGIATDTAINRNIAYMIESNNIINEMQELIEKLEPNQASVNNTLLQLNRKRQYLKDLTVDNHTSLLSFQDGLRKIQNRSYNYNIPTALARLNYATTNG